MTIVRDEIIAKLFHGNDPFARVLTRPVDIQGWNSNHPYLTDAIDKLKPDIAVEVGVWKGASVLTMANRMREIGCDGVVIACDTWLGSTEHWLQIGVPPDLYGLFASNVMAAGACDYIVPFRLDSVTASEVLTHLGIRPSVIHIDAAHDYRSVMTDLSRWWSLLTVNGMMIVDDYDSWSSVTRAVDDFRDRMRPDKFEFSGNKCRFVKS